jgi:hypothetical protein
MSGIHNDVLKFLPSDTYYKFLAILSRRAGLHRSLARSFRPLMDKGLGMSDWGSDSHEHLESALNTMQ